jgi:GntR family transcriptional regulator of abcA and norABC
MMSKTYKDIVLYIRDKIKIGEWSVNDKIPTQGELSKEFKLNRTTVIKALDTLKVEGIIYSVQGKGTFVAKKTSSFEWDSLTKWSFFHENKKLVQLINKFELDKGLIQLSKGTLGNDLLPVEMINKSLSNISKVPIDHEYGDGKGNYKLRAELSYYLYKKGIKASPESIMITSGALNGIQLISTGILQTGTNLVSDKISFINSLDFLDQINIKLVPKLMFNANSSNLVDMKENVDAIYLNTNHQNPTTYSFSEKIINKSLEYANQNNTLIIEDDIYGDLNFDHKISRPLKSYDSQGRVLYVSSFSKTISPSFRVGFIYGAEKVINRLSDIRLHTDYGSSILSQLVFHDLLSSGEYFNHLFILNNKLKERCAILINLLETYLSKYGSFQTPSGGFFVWFTFYDEYHIPMYKLFKLAYSRGVLINPGSIYGDSENNSIRFSFSYESMEKIELGILQIKQLLDNWDLKAGNT